jgi:hypothetical protein
MRTTQASLIVVSTALALAALQPLSALAQGEPTAVVTATDTAKKDAQLLKIASPLEEVAELSKSGVGDAVIINYIQNSERTYNVGAKDIINLRNQGVSPEVTTALIQRGAEQRQTAATTAAETAKAQKAAEAETVAVAPTYQTQPTTTVVAAPATVTYYEPVRPASTVSVTYIGYPRYSYYAGPAYYSYPRSGYVSYGANYCYPRTSFAVGVGFGGYRGGYYGGHYRSSARYCR